MATSAQRALIAASFVVAGVAAFLLAYLFVGAGAPGPTRPESQGAGAPAAMGAVDPAQPASPVATDPPAAQTTAAHQAWQPAPSPLPPSPVGALRLASNTMSDFTVTWDPAVDNSGIRYYRVLVNGFAADTTSTTQATLGWLAGKRPILVQVAAVDLDGNYGPWSALYVIPPPDPAPVTGPAQSPTPTASGTPTAPVPTATPSSGATSAGSPSPTASVTPTATATASDPSSASASPSATASPGL